MSEFLKLLNLSSLIRSYLKGGISLVAQWERIHLPMQETRVWSLGQEDPLEKEMKTHSSILAWEIPWTEKPGGLRKTVGHDLASQTVKRLSTMWETQVRSLGQEGPWRRKWQSTPVLLPGKSHGQRSLVDYSPWSRKELDMTERSSSSLHVWPPNIVDKLCFKYSVPLSTYCD